VGGIAIPAHIDGKQGLLENISSLTKELEKSIEPILAAEFCNIHKFDDADPQLKKSVDRLAKLKGSDAHKPEQIGRHSISWLKMSQPSIEGLRLALMDYELCLKNQEEDPNVLPDLFISKLTIQNMSHCGRIFGQPFAMPLHPHFNAVIGGRGTGKSTVLESIRIGARRDQELATEAPKVKKELDKFMGEFGKKGSKNSGVMLQETEILLELTRRDKAYRLRWQFDGKGAVLEEREESGYHSIDAGDVRERFPVNIYSQKQINELASNPRGLLEIVDRSSEVDRMEWKTRWESTKSRFLQLRERQRELSRQLADEKNIKAKLTDVANDLKQYEEKGHGEILKQYQKRSQQKNGLPSDRIFDELAKSLRQLADTAELSDFPKYLFSEDDEIAELKAIHEQAANGLLEISTMLNGAAENVELLKEQRNKAIESSKWSTAVRASVEAYNNLIKEYEEKKSKLSISLYGEWVAQRNTLQKQLEKLKSVREEISFLDVQIREILGKLFELRKELFDKRRTFLENVIGGSAFVRMELVPFGDVDMVEDEYRAILNLEEGKFTSSVNDSEHEQGVLWQLLSWDETGINESDLPDIIAAVKSESLAIAQGQQTGNHRMFDNRLKKLLENQPSVFDHLDAWWPEDMLRVKYSREPASGKFEDLEKGSAGQKAAAILAFLLSHGNEPLIIDQPEDDLDNALIYDLIVTQIHKNKERRQLIIVTHNPNIVVNGDAELVHVLKFQRGQIQLDQQGGLEETNIREAICTIMEGGKQAFEKRYKRIMLEK
jgi:ABC-type lipoprotein export system ATPase subunit